MARTRYENKLLSVAANSIAHYLENTGGGGFSVAPSEKGVVITFVDDKEKAREITIEISD